MTETPETPETPKNGVPTPPTAQEAAAVYEAAPEVATTHTPDVAVDVAPQNAAVEHAPSILEEVPTLTPTPAPAAPPLPTPTTTPAAPPLPPPPPPQAAASKSPASTTPRALPALASGPGLRLRMKIWTDPQTGKRYLMPTAFMRDTLKGRTVSDAMYAYAMTDDETKLVHLNAKEWNALPFAYFREDGPAPRGTSRLPDVVR